MYLKIYKPDNVNRLRHPISQSGRGLSVNRYIYNQRGAGIGNFFSKLFRTVIPAAIKGSARILKPHAEKIARQALTVGSEIAANKVNDISNKIQYNLNKARPNLNKDRPKKRPPKTDRKSKKRKDLFNAKILSKR